MPTVSNGAGSKEAPDSPLEGGSPRPQHTVRPRFESPGQDTAAPPLGGIRARPELDPVAQRRQRAAMSRLLFADITPQTVTGVMQQLEVGRLEKAADLWAKCLGDAFVRRADWTRRSSVANRPIGVEPSQACPKWKTATARDNADHAEMVVKSLQASGAMEQAILQQLCATVLGINILRTDWGTRDGWFLPEKFTPILARDIRLDLDWTPLVRDHVSQWHRVAAHAGRFWCHRPETTNGLLIDQGTFRGVAWLWLFKTAIMRWRMFAAERFGTPLVVGLIEQELQTAGTVDASTRTALEAALKKLTVDSVAVAPSGTRIDVIDPKGTGSADIYKQAIEDLNTEIQVLMLGMTTMFAPGSVGSYSAEEVRNGARLESTAQDSRLVLGSFMRDVVWWSLYYNGFDTDPSCLPEIKTILTSGEMDGPQTTAMQAIVTAAASGQIPRDAAEAILERAYALTPGEADSLLGSSGKGFVQAPPQPNVTERLTPGGGGAGGPFPPKSRGPLGGMPDL